MKIIPQCSLRFSTLSSFERRVILAKCIAQVRFVVMIEYKTYLATSQVFMNSKNVCLCVCFKNILNGPCFGVSFQSGILVFSFGPYIAIEFDRLD